MSEKPDYSRTFGGEALAARLRRASDRLDREGPLPFVVGLNRSDRSRVIAETMAARGYSLGVIEKVLGRNFLRVFDETWRVS